VSAALAGRGRVGLGLLRARAPDDQQLAEVLNRFATQFDADSSHDVLARRAIVVEDPHLDQLVGFERGVDLAGHRGREAVLPDVNHGVQTMRPGAKRPAFGRG
jgi:hypothetical protein